MSSVGNKRKRSGDDIFGINTLTDDLLVFVSGYLPKTSRALLAVALTAPSSSWRKCQWKGEPTATSRSIISSAANVQLPTTKSMIDALTSDFDGKVKSPHHSHIGEHVSYTNYTPKFRTWGYGNYSENIKFAKKGIEAQIKQYYEGGWEILDFVDIPKSLASRLNDEDLGAILKCIDAKEQLKRLNLTYCFQVVGDGLEPLRGSTVLEKADLGLVRQYEVPQIFDDAQLCDEVVYGILSDVIEGGSFERLQLPISWLWDITENSERLTEFLAGYNLASLVKGNVCAYFGITNDSLIEHLASKENTDVIDECIHCLRRREFRVCSHCNNIVCFQCGDEDEAVLTCSACDMVSCESCRDSGAQNPVQYCLSSYCESYCEDCRVSECSNGTNECDGCRSMVFDRVLEERDQTHRRECDRLRSEINQQQVEIEQLRLELRQLRAGQE